ncbi:hypothetical protein AYI70_g1816 [Smittium culicis]|uniref:Uncharacterized protein n=1 Tax=Smittium culicis TaxID=133412 RepID=A0A1R1Y2N8_9FUNG|nr:hypothetical protein AYI70_g3739 [Smittium culicis]OMJ24097.1 hypothetical protein AYI70_g1816 [Smittium culicis]
MSKDKSSVQRLEFLELASNALLAKSPIVSAILGRNILEIVDCAKNDELQLTKYSKFTIPQKITSRKINRKSHSTCILNDENGKFRCFMCKFCGNLLQPGYTANSFRVISNSKELNLHLQQNKAYDAKSPKSVKNKGLIKVEAETRRSLTNLTARKKLSIMEQGSRNVISLKCNMCYLTSIFLCSSQYKALQISKAHKIVDKVVLPSSDMVGEKVKELLEMEKKRVVDSEKPKPRELTPLELRAAEIKKASMAKKPKLKKSINIESISNIASISTETQLVINNPDKQNITSGKSSVIPSPPEISITIASEESTLKHTPTKNNDTPSTNSEIASKIEPHLPQTNIDISLNSKKRKNESNPNQINQKLNKDLQKGTTNILNSKNNSQKNSKPNQNSQQQNSNNSQLSTSNMAKKRKANSLSSLQSLLKKKEKTQTDNKKASNGGKLSLTDFLNTL